VVRYKVSQHACLAQLLVFRIYKSYEYRICLSGTYFRSGPFSQPCRTKGEAQHFLQRRAEGEAQHFNYPAEHEARPHRTTTQILQFVVPSYLASRRRAVGEAQQHFHNPDLYPTSKARPNA
jgi:hypothetical protein